MSFEKTTPEYAIIKDFYGEQTAIRSGVKLIRHIDEGLAILDDIKAREVAKRAYCLHPLLQADDTLAANYAKRALYKCNPYAIVVAMEYRRVANGYLSPRHVDKMEEIDVGPLKEVSEMLIADKVQNYKDFHKYHTKHPRFSELDYYFKMWFVKLGLTTLDVARLEEVCEKA